MKTKLLILLPVIVLAGCGPKYAVFDPQACPVEKKYSADEQKQAKAALRKSPSIIQNWMVGYFKLREKTRACRTA